MICILFFFGLMFFFFKRSNHSGYAKGQSWFNHLKNESRDSHHSAPASTEDNAMQTARERLAKGELSPEEFEAIKNALS